MENAEQQVQRKQRGSFGAGKPWKEPICRDAGRVLAWRFVNEAQGATEQAQTVARVGRCFLLSLGRTVHRLGGPGVTASGGEEGR